MSKFFPSIVIFLLSFHVMAGQISPELTLEDSPTAPLDGTPYMDSNTPALSIDLDSEMQAIQPDPLQNIEFNDNVRSKSAPPPRTYTDTEYTPSQTTNTDELAIDMRRELELDELKNQWGELKKEARSIKDELESEVNTSLSSIGLDITSDTERNGNQSQNGGYYSSGTNNNSNNTPSLTLYYHKIMNFIDDHPILIFVIACCLLFVIVAKSVLTFSR